jgi:hypothetical protein
MQIAMKLPHCLPTDSLMAEKYAAWNGCNPPPSSPTIVSREGLPLRAIECSRPSVILIAVSNLGFEGHTLRLLHKTTRKSVIPQWHGVV